jgi:hypothetical protein
VGLIVFKLASISFAVVVIGFLFTILKYEGAQQMLLIGWISLAIVFVVLIAYSIYTGFDKVRPYLIRIVVMGAFYAMLKFGMFS